MTNAGLPVTGASVATVGAPLGLEGSLTAGLISHANRKLPRHRLGLPKFNSELELLQTDAVVHPGNSGGPLIDRRGRVIGIVLASHGVHQRVGYALPASEILAALKECDSCP